MSFSSLVQQACSGESISMCPIVKLTISFVQCIFLTILVQRVSGSKNNELYSSITGLNSLVKAEEGIVKAIHDYISSLEDRVKLAKAYLKDQEDVEQSDEGLLQSHNILTGVNDENTANNHSVTSSQIVKNQREISDSVSSHPLRSFRLIRRFVKNLPEMEMHFRKDYEKKFLRVIEKIRKSTYHPGQGDLEAATQGLLRVQDAYNFDINEFTEGQFDDLKTNTSLNAADCYFIGVYSLQANIYTRAIEWLQRAYFLNREQGDTSISLKEAQDQLQQAILVHNKALLQGHSRQSPYLYSEPLEHVSEMHGPVKRRTRMLDKQIHKLYETKSSFTDLINFAELCRGGQLQTGEGTKNLKCYYVMDSPQNRLSPLKVEELHEDPPVVQIYNILSDRVIDDILAEAKPSLVRSKVHGKTKDAQKIVSVSRTSTSTWIKEAKIITKLSILYQTIQTTLGLNMKEKDACEDFQVTNYAITGHYNPHQDNILSSEFARGMSAEEINKGDRLATLMFYLSDVEKGGWTAFPRIGVVARPVKGSGIFWFNMKPNGETEPLALHGGCPVVYGNKWIANQWIRANSQMFTRKCPHSDPQGTEGV